MFGGGHHEDLLGDLPLLERNARGEEELHDEEVELDLPTSEEVGLDVDASGDQALDPSELLHSSTRSEGSSIGDDSCGLDGDEPDDDLVADSVEYGWADYGNAPTGDDDWDDDLHDVPSSPLATVEDLGEAGLEEEEEGRDEALSLPPLDADEPDDDWADEGEEIEGFLPLEDSEVPIGVET